MLSEYRGRMNGFPSSVWEKALDALKLNSVSTSSAPDNCTTLPTHQSEEANVSDANTADAKGVKNDSRTCKITLAALIKWEHFPQLVTDVWLCH